MRWRRGFIVAALMVAALVSCRQRRAAAGNPPLTSVTMKLGKQSFVLEVAKTAETRERGLMRRDSMEADHGMIFVFRGPQNGGFWMRNTRIPLDIVYVDANGKVLTIKGMKPYEEKGVFSDGEYKWAIELNQGAASGAGLKVGDVVEIPAGAREAAE